MTFLNHLPSTSKDSQNFSFKIISDVFFAYPNIFLFPRDKVLHFIQEKQNKNTEIFQNLEEIKISRTSYLL